MPFLFPDELLNEEIHLPDLILKGKSVLEALERHQHLIVENINKSKMSNKKVIKEAITPEQKQALMGDAVSVATSVLKLFKTVTTEINSPTLTSYVNSLKAKSDELMSAIEEQGGGTDEADEDKIDLESTGNRRSVIESVEVSNKNTRVSLKEQEWKTTIDLKEEFGKFMKSPKKLVECKNIAKKLHTYTENINKKLSQDELNLFENIAHDFELAKSINEFNNSLTGLYDWADSNNVQVILK